jgi:FkbM family methyltransferase
MKNSMTNEEFVGLFDSNDPIFFIQIGANDGVHADPINKLIKSKENWSGILFEPGIQAFEGLKNTYKNFDNLILVNSAVSDTDGKTILYCGETTPHFTLDKTKAIHMFNITPKEVKVDVISPKTIISKYKISKIGLLQVDTEGRDFTIIKSFFEDNIFPDIIRFEYVNLSYENTDASQVMNYLSKFGYTSYYVENEGDIISILESPNSKLIEENKNEKMKKIKIHRFTNKLWGRAHLPFFQRFENFLREKFDVEFIEYNKDGNTFTGQISTLKPIYPFGTNPPLSDVDCVIENLHTAEIKVLSFGEYFNNFVSHYAKSEHCSKVLLTHFNWHNLYYWMKREFSVKEMYKVKPWIFLPFQEFDYLKYREKRDTTNNFDNKMFFLGSGISDYRKCIEIIENMGYLQPSVPVSHSEYFEKLSCSKIAVSYYQSLDRYRTPFDYPGEFCYRDVEYMSLGVPFIRVEFRDTTHDPWIPNYHYISIPRDVAHIIYEKEGEQGIANLYIEKYKEVINDEDFLNYISKNQKDWFDRNITSPNIEKLTFDLLELQKWIESENTELYGEQKIDVSDEIEVNKKENLNDTEILQEFLSFLKTKNLLRNSTSNKLEPIFDVGLGKDDSFEKIVDLEKFDSTTYKGFLAQQQRNALDVFKKFLIKVRPSRILEIGTAGGGLTMFLRDTLNEIGLSDSKIKSFEVLDCSWYDKIRSNNIEINLVNIFNDSYTQLENPEYIVDFIQSEGTTVVLCDGGNKISEFNLIAPLIKNGDFIMAHDYIDTKENFEENYKNKIWNWCEIEESHISDISQKENLVHFNKEEFDKVVWVCKQKVKI